MIQQLTKCANWASMFALRVDGIGHNACVIFYPGNDIPIPLPEILIDEKGWETNVYHSKVIEVSPAIYSLTSEEERTSSVIDTGTLVVEQSSGYTTTIATYTSGWLKATYEKCTHNSAYNTSGIVHYDYFYSLSDKCIYRDGYNESTSRDGKVTRYTYPRIKITSLGNANRHGSVTSFETPTLINYFDEETINSNPPLSEEEPFVGRGYQYHRQLDKSFASNEALDAPKQAAYFDAFENLATKLNDNNIQNVTGAMSAIKILSEIVLAFRAGKIPKSLKKDFKSLWMWYRYSYCTTISDLDEAEHWLLSRSTIKSVRTAYGHSRFEHDGSTCEINCTIKGRGRNDLDPLHRTLYSLWNSGFEINPYVLWDSLPLSFVVDWALPVGDVLKVVSDRKYFNTNYFDIRLVMFSLKYQIPLNGYTVENYSRWRSRVLELDATHWFSKDGVSGLCATKRAIDTVCLVSNFV